MEKTTGDTQVKTLSGLTLNRSLARMLEVLLLVGLGALAILLHARFRSPLNIPGHHGIEFMALLILGRLNSRIPYASTISSMGIGLLLLFPVFGFKDPMMGFNYMLPGILLDFYYNLGDRFRKNLLFLALIAGFSYMAIPLSRLIINIGTGYQYGSFIKHGVATPFITFAFFGLMGGLLGTGVSKMLQKFLNKISG